MVIASIAAPLTLLCSWLFLAALVVGAGLIVRRALGGSAHIDGHTLFKAFWTGAFTITLVLQIWHFFLPINAIPAALIAAVGLAGLAGSARPIALAATRPGGSTRAWLVLVLVLVIGWWLGNQALGEVAAFDTTMYHVPAVEWFRAHPLVPGLANLHGRFGFNNSSFLLAALLESALWKDGSVLLLNGVFVTVTLARGLHAALRWRSAAGAARVQTALDVVLIAPVLAVGATPALFRSLNADVPAAMAVFAGLSLLASALASGARAESRTGRADAVMAALVFTLAAAYKLSVALVAFPAWLIAIGLLARDRAIEPGATRTLSLALAASVLLIGTWLVRGVVLSGYPLYPLRVLAFPVEWSVPAEQAAAESAWIRFFAWTWHEPGMYNAVDPVWLCRPASLIRPWLRSLFRADVLWQVVVPATLAVGLALSGLRHGLAGSGRIFAAWMAALILASAAWLALAPRPLFGFGLFWSCAAVAAAFRENARAAGDTDVAHGRLPILISMLVALAAVAGNAVHAGRAAGTDARSAVMASLYTAPDPDSWFVATRWEYPAREYITDSGLELLVPAGHRCGRAPLPCTSHPAPNLRLRRPDDLRSGFVVDGEWRAERFPSPFTNFLEVWRTTRPDTAANACSS
ncbi:MAG: hypothetical protein L0271_00035 [Gemmatimonadetes bacterium]|nr:hypothetical protein [Gemmatimonadota bacterium]